jgi:hypothetical protein
LTGLRREGLELVTATTEDEPEPGQRVDSAV